MFGFQKIQKKCNGIFALNLRLTNISLFQNRAYLDFMYEGNITEELKRLADFTVARKSKLLLMMNNKREREFFYPRRC